MLGNMKLLGAIKVHESGLEKDTLSLNLSVHLGDSIHHGILVTIGPDSLCLDSSNSS